MRFLPPAILALLLPSLPAAAACPEVPAPYVGLTTESAPVRLVRTMTARELTGLGPGGEPAAGALPRQIGRTVHEYGIRTNLAVESVENAPGCYRLTEIDVTIRTDRLDIFIASELEPESCAWRATLGHERQHVEIVRDALAAVTDELGSQLRDPNLARAIAAPDIDTALRRFRDAISVIAGDARRRAHADAVRRNAAIDTPQSYRALQATCPRSAWRAPFE